MCVFAEKVKDKDERSNFVSAGDPLKDLKPGKDKDRDFPEELNQFFKLRKIN